MRENLFAQWIILDLDHVGGLAQVQMTKELLSLHTAQERCLL